ncbi:MAG: glycosyltransferase [Nitrospirota bacterium]|nr:glycosyltransferase [Nitrospirota bacterium]
MPRISVVTPSFNQGQFLDATIRSVLDQDYPNLEYMVVDGGSTDNSVDVIEKYADRLAWWVSEPDNGQTDAINKGLRRSTGDIVAYLNSDDLYEPGAFWRVAEYFEQHPEVDLVYSDLTVIDAEGRRKQVWKSRPFNVAVQLCRNFIFQPTVFIRRRVLDALESFDPALHYVMDVDFWYRASLSFNFAYLHEPLAMFRLHDESKTGGSRIPFVREREVILERFFRQCRDQRVLRQESRIRSWHNYHGAEQLYSGGEISEARSHFLKAMKLDLFSFRTPASVAGVLDSMAGFRLFPLVRARLGKWIERELWNQ